MQDIKITKAIINEREELVCSFICKKGDYTDVDLTLLRNAKKHGDALDISFEGLTPGLESEGRNKQLQYLGALVAKYCEARGITEFDETKRIYERNGVESRKDMTDDQISFEIESYKTGLTYNF